jgi:hypothetical protein
LEHDVIGDDGRDRDVHVFTPCVPWVCLGSSKSLMSVVMNLAPGVERAVPHEINRERVQWDSIS